MGRKNTMRMLGCADYEAKWIDDSLAVRITARGFLPCANHFAQLEVQADGCCEMVFYTQDSRDESYSPFFLQAIVMLENNRDTVLLVDALGQHEIRVKPTEAKLREETSGQHIVYARNTSVNVPDETYFTQPVGTKVLPIFKRAYGPASKADCEAFIASANVDFMMELDQLHAKIERAEVGED